MSRTSLFTGYLGSLVRSFRSKHTAPLTIQTAGVWMVFIAKLWRFCQRLEATRFAADSGPLYTGILLSYRRPQNIEIIASSLLGSGRLKRLIIQNNNPEVSLASYLKLDDERIILTASPVRSYSCQRLFIASANDAEHFVSCDDDTFLTPAQFSQICSFFDRNNRTPVGIYGEMYVNEPGTFHTGIKGCNAPLDNLNSVYAFSKEHAVKALEKAARLGITATTPGPTWNYWDDVLLSHAEEIAAWGIDTGSFLRCPTSDDCATAIYKEPGFYSFRKKLLEDLKALEL